MDFYRLFSLSGAEKKHPDGWFQFPLKLFERQPLRKDEIGTLWTQTQSSADCGSHTDPDWLFTIKPQRGSGELEEEIPHNEIQSTCSH